MSPRNIHLGLPVARGLVLAGLFAASQPAQVPPETHAMGALSIAAVSCGGEPVAAIAEIVGRGDSQGKTLQTPGKLALVPGEWNVRIHSGPHCRSTARDVEIRAGETLKFGPVELQRVVDLRKLGWYAGTLGDDSIAESEGLDWIAPQTPRPAVSAISGRSYSASDGQIGALGPRTESPATPKGMPSMQFWPPGAIWAPLPSQSTLHCFAEARRIASC